MKIPKRQKKKRIESPRPGVYVTKSGLERLLNLTYEWFIKHTQFFEGVTQIIHQDRTYYNLEEVIRMMSPGLGDEEIGKMIFSMVKDTKQLSKIIVGSGENEYI